MNHGQEEVPEQDAPIMNQEEKLIKHVLMTETIDSERKQTRDTRAPRQHIPKKMFIWKLTN